jgi:hypothetical protein
VTVGSVVTTASEAPLRRTSWAEVRLLGCIAFTDLVFVAGVLVPYLTRAGQPTAGGPAWLGWPALASIFLLPLVAAAVAALAAGRLGASARSWWPGLVTLALAVCSFAAYVSPVGVAAMRWFLD